MSKHISIEPDNVKRDDGSSGRSVRWASLLYFIVVSALGCFLFGFDSAVISGCEQGIQAEYQLNDFWHGFTVAIALIGTVIGAFSMGYPADWYGRRRTLVAMALMYFVSAVGCAFPPDWLTLVVMRFIGGVAIGGSSVIVPLYIVEIVPPAVRGRLVAMSQLNIVVGILCSYISNLGVAWAIENKTDFWTATVHLANLFSSYEYSTMEIKWRLMFGVEMFPALLFLLLLFTIPESPRWLMRFGRRDEARKVLESIGERNVEQTLDEIENSLAGAQANSGKSVALFQRKYLWPCFLAYAEAAFSQLSGINAVIYYTPRIFEMCNLPPMMALFSSVILGTVNLIFTLLAMCVIDRWGRRPLLMIGSIGIFCVHMITAWQMSLGPDLNKWIAIPSLLGYIAFFACTQGAVLWVYMAEVFPNAVRAKGQALGSFAHWSTCMVVSWTFPIIIGLSPNACVWIFVLYACLTLPEFFFAWKVMPETKDGTIEELEKKIMGDAA